MPWEKTTKSVVVVDDRTGAIAYAGRDVFEAFEKGGNLPIGTSATLTATYKIEVKADRAPPPPPSAPLAPIWSRVMASCIGRKDYDTPAYQAEIAKASVALLGFTRGWRSDMTGAKARAAVQAIKKLNPSIKVGQYTNLVECHLSDAAEKDIADKCIAEGWLLRTSAGATVVSRIHPADHDINILKTAFGEWYAARERALWFAPIPELDFWYFDNSNWRSRQDTPANWRGDGVDVNAHTDPALQAEFRKAMADHWRAAKALAPNVVQMGNPDNDLDSPEFRGQLGAAVIEAAIGKSWSIETWAGWDAMMRRYRAILANTIAPKMVRLGVHGKAADYQTLRYGLCSALLEDGLFGFSDIDAGYSSVPAFDEYDVALGRATTSAEMIGTVGRRFYEGGCVLVNGSKTASGSVQMPSGYRRFVGTQAPTVNDGSPAGTVIVPPRDGIVLVKG